LLVIIGSMAFASGSGAARPAVGWSSRSTVRTTATASASDEDSALVVISRRPQITNVDNPPEGFSAGDLQAVTSPLFAPGGERRIGGLDVNLLVTLFNAQRERDEVTLTARLPQGQIEATGSFLFSEQGVDLTLGVTGGTGRYRDVGGRLDIVFFGNNNARLTFHLVHLN
jgi:hypothetical protein